MSTTITKLKQLLVESLSPEELKEVLADCEGPGADRRSPQAMRDALLAAADVSSEMLFEYFDESWVKHVCGRLGLSTTGRRVALIRLMLREERKESSERTPSRIREQPGKAAPSSSKAKELTPDEEKMYALVPADGRAIGNKSLREKLEWKEQKYWRVRDGLIGKELLLVGAGRGGSVFRPPDEGTGERNSDTSRTKTAATRVAEEDLYPSVCKMIENNWLQLLPGFPKPAKIWVDSSPRLGSRKTGGKWTRPDVSAITLNRYKYIPGSYLDIFTFEVKPADQFNVLGVYEALAHSRRGNFAYVLYHIGASRTPDMDDELELIIREANRQRVGLATFEKPDDADTWTVHAVPGRHETEPRFLDEFIGMLPEDIRDEIQFHVKS